MRVYIAGPISQGDLGENLRNAVRAANAVLHAGHHPYLPHLSIYWALLDPPGGSGLGPTREENRTEVSLPPAEFGEPGGGSGSGPGDPGSGCPDRRVGTGHWPDRQ